MSEFRLLVAGSRTLRDRAAVEFVLDRAVRNLAESGLLPGTSTLVVVHGAADGADRLAALWAVKRGHRHEPHSADWKAHGKAAGFHRNQVMLDSGVDWVVAITDKPLDQSRGTCDMVGRCRKSGVRGVAVVV